MSDPKDLHHSIEVEEALVDTAVAADADGTTIDLLGFNGCEFLVYVGASGSFSGSAHWSLEIEEATDNAGSAGTWSDVAETDLLGAISGTTTGRFALIDDAAEDELWYRVGYRGIARFVRLHVEKTGAPDAVPIHAIAIKCNPVYMPTANP